MKYTVTGHISEGEPPPVPFKETYSGADKAEARWAARRDQAPGKAGKLEKLPPNPEREAVEIAAPNTQAEALEQGQVFFHPRTEKRSAEEVAEYERLVAAVHIESVVEHARGGTGGAK